MASKSRVDAIPALPYLSRMQLTSRGPLRALLVAALSLCATACNDLTEPLPKVDGTYTYQSFSPDFASLNRNGTVKIEDFNRRTATFSGTFDFVSATGERETGFLTGAFVTRDHIYFRFLNTRFQVHEADYLLGRANGEIFFQGIFYESSGATFTLAHR